MPQNQIPPNTTVNAGKVILNNNVTDAENRLAAAESFAAGRAQANGVAPLDANAKLPTIHLPPLAINDTFSVASQAAMLALTAQRGDMAIRTDVGRTFVLAADDPSTLASWMELASPSGGVSSVDGRSGVVDLSDRYAATSHGHANATASTAGFESSADKVRLDGLLQVAGPEVPLAAATVLTASAFGKMHLCSGSANYTVTLPPSSSNSGKVIGVRIDPPATALITIKGNAAENIDGQNTRVLWAQESCLLLCTGTGWTKIAGRTRPMMCGMRIASATPATAQLIPNALTQKVLLNQTDFDDGWLADPSAGNNKINVRRGGKYNVGLIIYYAITGGASPRIVGNIQRSDGSKAAQAESSSYSALSYAGVNVNALAELATGDSLILNTLQTSGGDKYLYGDPATAATLMTIEQVIQW